MNPANDLLLLLLMFFYRVVVCSGVNLLKGVAQEEADLATVVSLFAFALVALGSVELRLDLPNTGDLLLLLTVEIRTGELVSHGLGPKQTHKSSEGEY